MGAAPSAGALEAAEPAALVAEPAADPAALVAEATAEPALSVAEARALLRDELRHC